MKYFDLHCDTLSELYYRHDSFENTECMISAKNIAGYDEYAQLFAIYSRNGLSDDENYDNFFKILDNARYMMKETDKFHPYLAVEGGKLTGGDVARLDKLYEAGVRFLTIVWGGETVLGGAHDTHIGLSEAGKKIVRRCFELGIVPDVSHASDETFEDVYNIALEYEKPIIATHSNSRSVCRHTRNLTDDMFRKIVGLGGIVGLNMYHIHLSPEEHCNIDKVIEHLDKYLLLGGEDSVCFGGDLDGIDYGPDGIDNVSDMYKIADRMVQLNYPQELIDKLYYKNAEAFMTRNKIFCYGK